MDNERVLKFEGPLSGGHANSSRNRCSPGFFRSKGIAVVVQIPEPNIQEFGNELRRKGFSAGPPVGPAHELLSAIEAATRTVNSSNTMVNYEDEALAIIEEPFSDCSTAIYDLDTGLFCYIEYDE